MSRTLTPREELLNIPAETIARECVSLQSKQQEKAAQKELEAYFDYLMNNDVAYCGELSRKIQRSPLLREHMTAALLQTGSLLMYSFWGDTEVFQELLRIAKDAQNHESDDVKRFRHYLVSRFSLSVLENELGIRLTDKHLALFSSRMNIIKGLTDTKDYHE